MTTDAALSDLARNAVHLLPEDGLSEKLKLGPPLLVPPGVVTLTTTFPSACAGTVAVIVVSLTTVNAVALTPPKVTAVAPVNPVPVRVTPMPPAVGPADGLTVPTVGAPGSV